MSSSKRDFFPRTLGLRLTAWYSGFFTLSLLTLFALVHVTLDSMLRKKDREIINAKLKEMAEEYKEDGLPELRRIVLEKRASTFFIRVSDAAQHTLLQNSPEGEEPFPGLENAIAQQSPANNHWLVIPTPHHLELELANERTVDGNFLQVGRSTQRRQLFLRHFREICAAVIFPMILLALAGGAFLARRALAPIRDLTDAVQSIIATGKIDARISPRHTDGELSELVVSFNQMLGRIDALIQGMRSVLDNVAHDLRTPLTRLRGLAEMALQNPRDVKTAQEALADCLEESDRVLTMLNTLMDISEAETGAMRLDLTKVPVREIVGEIVELYHEVAEEKNIVLSISSPADLVALADVNRLRQAIANLVDNALKYTPSGGQVCLEISRADGCVVIGVRDSGMGIPHEEISHVWERLYRGDKSRSQRGLGLGLSLVKAIAQAHSGRCEVESEPGRGSLFRLHLPVVA